MSTETSGGQEPCEIHEVLPPDLRERDQVFIAFNSSSSSKMLNFKTFREIGCECVIFEKTFYIR